MKQVKLFIVALLLAVVFNPSLVEAKEGSKPVVVVKVKAFKKSSKEFQWMCTMPSSEDIEFHSVHCDFTQTLKSKALLVYGNDTLAKKPSALLFREALESYLNSVLPRNRGQCTYWIQKTEKRLKGTQFVVLDVTVQNDDCDVHLSAAEKDEMRSGLLDLFLKLGFGHFDKSTEHK